ncbi:hypothetical protein SEUCBS139899_007807 [Sporothrix eucalyptigena]|uniref:Sca1-like protein n=1 Tax=Sporothrix eucalyptigena TaxID=1812306 RepID=A0ABP0AQ39_9PEZI
MPSLARKVLICAAVDGLILHPLSHKKDQRPAPSVKIRYGDAALSTISRDPAAEAAKPSPSFEAFGIVGLILVSRFSYLVSITKRQQVATIRGCPVYVVTEVALTPCASYSEARVSVESTIESLKERPPSYITDEESESEDDHNNHHDEDIGGSVWIDDIGDDHEIKPEENKIDPSKLAPPTKGHKSNNSIAEDVISRRGSYGRFAQRWFSRSGWLQEQKRLMGLTGSNKSAEVDEEAVTDQAAPTDASAAQSTENPSTEALSEQTPSTNVVSGDNSTADPSTTEATTTNTASSTPPLKPSDHSNSEDSAVISLLPKLLRTTQMLFGASRSFYFSYDYDITRSVAKQPKTRWNDLPLYKLVDTTYFWNRHAMQPFIDAGADVLSLPLMQGFVGQRSFVVDSNPPQVDEGAKDSVELDNFAYRASGGASRATSPLPATSSRTSFEFERRASEKQFDVTLISRRSVRRAGLRYLRRGVDEEGNVANAVETEQILSPSTVNQLAESQLLPEQPLSKTYSFVQIRGSIPLFWTQSPFSLKPAPVIQHSLELNFGALKNHFDSLRREYGSLQVVNLVEKHGVEAPLGTQFERSVQRYNDETNSIPGEVTIPFEWFDFHSACKGMKFENVSLLMGKLSKKIEELGSTVEETGGDTGTDGTSSPAGTIASNSSGHGNGSIVQKQKGVLRTNCMDCLDRTNVCQSSFAKFMLDTQLKEQGFDMAAQHDQENAWFNTLWADNGDAVSKQYASTAAMKGDYTRTRKRDYRGALTDAGLSLTRFFNGVVNDFFLQTTIDFLLGNVTDKIFDEFEANMMTKDPAMSMQKMREQAIDLCQRRVVADESEEFIGGWTLIAPHDAGISLTTPPFEEVVLLVTDAALYLCRFDWNLDKLSSFERVELSHIDKITIGTYIVSTVSPMQMDEGRNVGFLVTYRPGRDDIMRINTRSLSSMHLGDSDAPGASAAEALSTSIASFLNIRPTSPPAKRLAFKALYAESSLAPSATSSAAETVVKRTEKDQVMSIASEIERLILMSRPVVAGAEHKTIISKGDIVSLAEARKSTGLLGHLGHSLKKLVWA